ncbi:hypothetical protein [Rhodanobacter umsongensis]
MPKKRNISGNIFDSHVASLTPPTNAQTIEAENQKFFDRMDRRYARIYTWANNREKDEVTEQLALLLLLTLEDKKRRPIREKVMGEMLSEAYGKQRKQWMDSKSGGRNAGEQKKADAREWQEKCVEKARDLLLQGTSPRSLAGILAKRFGRTSRTINIVLKKAEVK